MLQKIKTTIKDIGMMSAGLTLAFIIFIGLSISNAWTEPTVAPPGGNLGAPLNTSATSQTKSGSLTATSSGSAGLVGSGSIGTAGIANAAGGWSFYAGANAGNGLGLYIDSSLVNGIQDSTSGGSTFGKVKAAQYCDYNGANCKAITAMGGGTTNVYSCPVLAQDCYGHYQAWYGGCNGQLQTSPTCTHGNCATITANCTLIGKL